MSWSFYILTTDILIWSVIILTIISVVLYRKSVIFQKIRYLLQKRPTSLICFYIILIYFSFALLDSIHLQKVGTKGIIIGTPVSLLDITLKKLHTSREKTYSSPLSLHLYSLENVVSEDGEVSRIHAPLRYSGKHLREGQNPKHDIIARFILVFFTALVFTLTLYISKLFFKQLFSPVRDQSFTWHMFLGYPSVFIFWFCIWSLFFCYLFLNPYYHLLGTDITGNDVLYLTLKSIRTSVLVGVLTIMIIIPLSIILGIIAGYLGKVADSIIQYIYTTISSIPSILLIAAGILLFQIGTEKVDSIISADKRLLSLILIMGLSSWTGLCRLVRAETLKIKELEFVQASKALGMNTLFILRKHILPNVMHLVIITAVLQFSGLVLVETILAYVGIGVDPSTYSWGNMINQARLELSREPVIWWNIFAAFTFMLGLVLPINILGDTLRDALDPRNT